VVSCRMFIEVTSNTPVSRARHSRKERLLAQLSNWWAIVRGRFTPNCMDSSEIWESIFRAEYAQ